MKTLLFLLLAGTGFSCSSYLGTTTVQTPVQSFNAAAYNLPDSCEGFTPQDWIPEQVFQTAKTLLFSLSKRDKTGKI